MLEIPAASTVDLRVAIEAIRSGVVIDPTGYTVQMALTPPGGTVTWLTASWDTDPTTTPDTYEVLCLVGPAGMVTLTAGVIYQIHVKVAASPEVPVIACGPVKAIAP